MPAAVVAYGVIGSALKLLPANIRAAIACHLVWIVASADTDKILIGTFSQAPTVNAAS
jgi:hypothetical protein